MPIFPFPKKKYALTSSRIFAKTVRFSTRIIAVALFLLTFILAIEFIKVGIEPFSDTLREYIKQYVNSSLASMGIGWFTSFLTVNSTSIAVLGMNLVGHDILNFDEGFYLILGSRIGSAAVILFLGIIFYLKGQSYRRSINVGLLTFLAILSTSLLAIFFGKILHLLKIDENMAQALHSPGQGPMTKFISESFTHNIAAISLSQIGPVLTFLIGFIMVILVIELLNKVFYIIDFSEHDFEKNPFRYQLSKLLRTRFFAFLMGTIIGALTLSITVTLSILIPLYTHETLVSKIKELFNKNTSLASRMLIPYALGANLGSFLDTFVFAKISGSTIGLTLAYNVFLSSLFSILLLFLIYRIWSDIMIRISNWALSRPAYLPEIIILLITFPLLLIFH
ncbi:hypothetical protein HZA41_02090 [Candidatus Peregrinibacteria bacterium]|nr:hypothetical protein [Candidatus Peregrinibacteria bacterium]